MPTLDVAPTFLCCSFRIAQPANVDHGLLLYNPAVDPASRMDIRERVGRTVRRHRLAKVSRRKGWRHAAISSGLTLVAQNTVSAARPSSC